MDKLYRVVIIDDDEFSADNLCLELKKYNRLSIDGMARNGVNGRKLLEKVHPDLLFLDVELPDMKGHGTAGTDNGGQSLGICRLCSIRLMINT